VHVVIDETGDDRSTSQVDTPRGGRRQLRHFSVRADRDDTVAADRNGLRQREALVDGDDLAVRQDHVGRWLLRWQGRDGTRQHERHDKRVVAGLPWTELCRRQTCWRRIRPSHVSSGRCGCGESMLIYLA
jgi:hypothetical protein